MTCSFHGCACPWLARGNACTQVPNPPCLRLVQASTSTLPLSVAGWQAWLQLRALRLQAAHVECPRLAPSRSAAADAIYKSAYFDGFSLYSSTQRCVMHRLLAGVEPPAEGERLPGHVCSSHARGSWLCLLRLLSAVLTRGIVVAKVLKGRRMWCRWRHKPSLHQAATCAGGGRHGSQPGKRSNAFRSPPSGFVSSTSATTGSETPALSLRAPIGPC